MLTAAATLGAVVVGYLLSVLTERRAWKQRKLEQLRERQLDTLILLITDINDLQGRYAVAARTIERMNAAARDMDLARQARDATVASIGVELATEIEHWRAAARNMERIAGTLRLLGLRESGMRHVLVAAKTVTEIHDHLCAKLTDPGSVSETDELGARMDSVLTQLMLHSREALAG